jgi:hypothetical protein
VNIRSTGSQNAPAGYLPALELSAALELETVPNGARQFQQKYTGVVSVLGLLVMQTVKVS